MYNKKYLYRDFDFSYIYYLEREKLKRMSKLFEEQKYVDNWQKIVFQMNLAVSLLDIILDDPIEEVYVNTRNVNRFSRYNAYVKVSENIKGKLQFTYLRYEKAWNLYHEFMKQYARNWWF